MRRSGIGRFPGSAGKKSKNVSIASSLEARRPPSLRATLSGAFFAVFWDSRERIRHCRAASRLSACSIRGCSRGTGRPSVALDHRGARFRSSASGPGAPSVDALVETLGRMLRRRCRVHRIGSRFRGRPYSRNALLGSSPGAPLPGASRPTTPVSGVSDRGASRCREHSILPRRAGVAPCGPRSGVPCPSHPPAGVRLGCSRSEGGGPRCGPVPAVLHCAPASSSPGIDGKKPNEKPAKEHRS